MSAPTIIWTGEEVAELAELAAQFSCEPGTADVIDIRTREVIA